ncbi:cytochrome D ubiquinol oxidase subunit I [Alkalihalobacillus alcalophilus ATCC 27647 = CGMCC 1.3604]|uniref:Cytochrome D ubiquinol oxidase subunit I n=1 Tax=Alkalihalobacillus alcalophilus ATCC 27647 = CGMCC 1.3604 TaxID=1218173 RepID=A0A094WCX1_ALKAL|nr:cytochrome ubiquinol oxidase subunit I [Alkalihalobacillus alcalophilus]KGA95624.1 cytochrome D ubiquinol oxidase subunit I [Alkalihalobacillus alcalophilus ATCC 27647 = CGMCC 1.3604]MED1564162.1 cytochrome ubiquinol oxidase subunit I [Alkalihalobacillus alcalophilus]THG91100.1 cytochrome D ubiquinol oxidase subunit I [Alkalihalobacillus alcalophilus ATCC 27647 = CGMCC 1.3604]
MLFEDPVFMSRMLTLLTLSFHIFYATVGVGLPLMILIFQWVGIRKNDMHYMLMARRWAKGFVVTVAVGVVTGTAIGLQLALLWPSFMELAGNIIALPLFMEVFAFFFEAIFLGIYLYTWDRFDNQKKHLLLLIPVAIGGAMSAFFITVVNSFMNSPGGFELINGEFVNVNPIAAMFTVSMPTKVTHVLATAYMTVAFVLAAIAAFRLLQGANQTYHKKSLTLLMKIGFVFALATALIGDLSGKYLAEYQPEKLAAAEWHFETTTEAPLILWGVLDENNEAQYAIEIPYALSILAHGDPFSEVIGLDQFPEEVQPPLVIHYFFDTMVTIGVFMLALSFIYWVATWRKWTFIQQRWYRWLIVLGGPLSFLAIQAGWWMAEVGRQPWILRGIMTIDEAATTSDYVGLMFILFVLLYLVLGIGTIVVLRRMFRDNPIEKDLERYSGGKSS